jgi:hypothetical protein
LRRAGISFEFIPTLSRLDLHAYQYMIPIQKRLRHVFNAALGSNQPGAAPDAHLAEDIEFTPKVKIEKKKAVGGGCG